MYFVYVIQDQKGNYYKGMTNDLDRRLKEHRAGYTSSTKYLTNLKIVYQEQFEDRNSARNREKYFKSAAGRKFLKKILSTDTRL
jgi:putative endonuclease